MGLSHHQLSQKKAKCWQCWLRKEKHSWASAWQPAKDGMVGGPALAPHDRTSTRSLSQGSCCPSRGWDIPGSPSTQGLTAMSWGSSLPWKIRAKPYDLLAQNLTNFPAAPEMALRAMSACSPLRNSASLSELSSLWLFLRTSCHAVAKSQHQYCGVPAGHRLADR